jgi:hypothetical protein
MVQLTYDQKKQVFSAGQKVGISVLEKTIVYSAQGLKFLFQFLQSLFRQFLGK